MDAESGLVGPEAACPIARAVRPFSGKLKPCACKYGTPQQKRDCDTFRRMYAHGVKVTKVTPAWPEERRRRHLSAFLPAEAVAAAMEDVAAGKEVCISLHHYHSEDVDRSGARFKLRNRLPLRALPAAVCRR